MDPINYMLDVKSPIDEYIKGFEFARNELANQQTMQINQQNMDVARQNFADQQRALREQRAAVSKQQEEALQLQSDLSQAASLAESGNLTSDYLRNMTMRHAKTLEDFGAAFSGKTEEQKSAQTSRSVNLAAALLGDAPTFGVKMLEEQIAAVGPNTEDAKPLQALLEVARTNPKAAGTSILFTGTATGIIPQASADMILKQTQPNQNAADVQSTDYLGGIAVVTTLKDGTVQIKDARTNQVVTGDAAKKLLDEAREGEALMAGGKSGAAEAAKLGAQADLGRFAAAETEMGAKAVQLGIDAFQRIGLVNANIANLDRAIQLVEEEGANTGVLANKLPNWSDASVELDNMQKTLGIDVIGSVTFGALSEGELALAMQTALPTNLSEKALSDWLRSKKAAQKKLAGYLTQQAEFFSTGRGPDQWIAFVRSGQKDVNKWMNENPLGGRSTAPAQSPEAPAATAPEASASEAADQAFIRAMMDKASRGETLTQAEMNRVNVIAAKGK